MKLGQHHRNAEDSELAGAVTIGPHVSTMHARVVDIFKRYGPLTDEELLALYRNRWGDVSKNSLEPRRTELVQQGRLRRTDERRKGVSGINRIVWALVIPAEQLALL